MAAKLIYGNLILWLAVKAFAPVPHVDTTGDFISIVPVGITTLLIPVPFFCLVYMILSNYNKTEKGIDRIFNVKATLIIGFTATLLVTIMQVYSLTIQPVASHGSLITWNMLIAIYMATCYKLHSSNNSQVNSICVAVMVVFFNIGIFELPYQLFHNAFHRHEPLLKLLPLLMRQIYFITPFLIAIFIFKIKLTKQAIICFLTFLVLYFIWLVPGKFWTIYPIQNGIAAEEINWFIYQVAKTTKVMLAITIFNLDYNGVKNEKLCNSKPV